MEGQLCTINCLALNHSAYPEGLRQIYDPPALLYYRGQLTDHFARPALAVVGSRHPSPYGVWLAQTLVKDLATWGLTIVSGLAIGLDGLAHQAALDAQGRTLAVLGSGLDDYSLYPQRHRALAWQILEQGGLLLSEHSLGTKVLPWHFPRRNRIVSGLSRGVLVLEANLPSGSLITAKHALEQNREVLVVPGPIDSPTSAGTNFLLKQGARPVTSAQDVMEALDLVIQP